MIFKRKKTPDEATPKSESKGLFSRLKAGLSRTSDSFGDLLLGEKKIDEDYIEQLEETLLMADVGIEASTKITTDLQKLVTRSNIENSNILKTTLVDSMQTLLQDSEKPLLIDSEKKPYVILVVGVNGAGKTTTIGKLAQRLQHEGKSVMLAAGDTFRAAAVEQLQTWGERHNIPVITQGTGADSAAVIFDAINAAKARDIDVIIADTAGRLHTQNNLMEELKKVARVIKKAAPEAPHETLLVLDAGIGQNAVSQASQFHQTTPLTGLVLTKLDGTAKGGIVFALSEKLKLPIRFIGVGEQAEDLQPFVAKDFIHALLGDDYS